MSGPTLPVLVPSLDVAMAKSIARWRWIRIGAPVPVASRENVMAKSIARWRREDGSAGRPFRQDPASSSASCVQPDHPGERTPATPPRTSPLTTPADFVAPPLLYEGGEFAGGE